MEATMRGALTQAQHRHIAQHAEGLMKAVPYLQMEEVCRAAAQMAHRKLLLLEYTERPTNTPERVHMPRLIDYHAIQDSDVH